jgi:4-hydroxy-tetrahydrodipicolinate reductase
VVSSTEELFFPWLAGSEEVWMLHELAKDRKVSVVGVGVNPGFVMDRLPSFLTQVCVNLRRVVVRRFVDLSTRRPQLQAKMGVGLTVSEYEEGLLEERLGHVGLPQSLAFLAASLGMEISSITETVEPVVGEDGKVIGTKQVASGWEGEYERVRLELRMTMGEPDPRDEIEIDADPPLRLIVPGGVAGDDATAAILVNTASWIDLLPPGVHSGAAWFPRIPLLPAVVG